jgi:hypothetical protein
MLAAKKLTTGKLESDPHFFMRATHVIAAGRGLQPLLPWLDHHLPAINLFLQKGKKSFCQVHTTQIWF